MAPKTGMWVALSLTVATVAQAQTQPVTKTNTVTTSATIQAIDSTTRMVTLRDEKGQEDTFELGPEVKRFNELKVGDKVKMTYYESLVFLVRKPGDKAPSTAPTGAITPGRGSLPGATAAAQQKASVTVKAIDPKVPSITVTTDDGRTVTRKINEAKYLEGLKPGDKIDITYTVAVVANIERAK
jgi:Cu/Ag efflux protein CusF